MNKVEFEFLCRTVEINNTDAEGRLVLGDGVCIEPLIVMFHQKINSFNRKLTIFILKFTVSRNSEQAVF